VLDRLLPLYLHIEIALSNGNPASMHILHKFGFEAIGTTANFLKLNNKQLSCIELVLNTHNK